MSATTELRPGEAFDVAMRLYTDLYEEWISAAGRFFDAVPSITLPAPKACCAVPPPCWMPRSLGEVTTEACPGSAATVCIRVVNRGPGSRTVTAETGSDGKGVTIANAPLQLGPMEEGTLVVSAGVEAGEDRRLLIWVRGCQEHYLRWNVKAARRNSCACRTVDVIDGEDGIHRWSDHFYCHRGCPDG